jgi:uncharacterized protein
MTGSPPLPGEVVDAMRALGSATALHLVPLGPHFDGAARGRIVLPWCAGCGSAHWYPALRCPRCCESGWVWRDVGTEAQLDTWTVVHHALAPALREHVPFTVGLLVPVNAPTVRIVSALGVPAAARLSIGQAMTARPGPEVDGGRLLVFTAAATDRR